MKRLRLILAVFTTLALTLAGCATSTPATPAAPAQAPKPAPATPAFPTKPIKIVVTHAAGGSTDMPGRIIAPYVEKILGQPLVFDNMVGAGGAIARTFVYKAAPDGYTLLQTQLPSFDMQMFTSDVDFNSLEFTNIYSVTGGDYLATAVKADSPINSLPELMESLKTKTYTIGGSAGASLIAVANYKSIAGDNISYVPYNTGAPAATDLGGGHIDMVVTNVSMLKPMEDQGLIKLLAVHGPERHKFYPDIPSVTELGFPDLAVPQMAAIFGPPDMPEEIRKAVADAYTKAGQDPQYLEDLKKAKLIQQALSGAEFDAFHQKTYKALEAIQDVLKLVSSQR